MALCGVGQFKAHWKYGPRCPKTGRPLLKVNLNCFYRPNADGAPIKFQPSDLVPSSENETYKDVELDPIALRRAIEAGCVRTAKEHFVELLKAARGIKEKQWRYNP
ncbi:hypothetical protein AJ80_08248 [Polytolypa hystricis UAMH7299]|uniref:Uncharacterized protein n=1 Tax=Polytolypa hystricis (strain UAMH7299) TaxID=1447883 RepID=A0A2B7XA05_POLH7|nr:hypothetical protein AJ80_08248 [Polytolypa hystricis UAMH7299]